MRWCCAQAWDNSLMDEGALIRCGHGHRWQCRRSKITGLLYWHAVSGAIGYGGYCVHCAMAAGKSPPVQEAPKAPVCRIVLQGGREHGGAVLERVWRSPLGVKKGAVCENCRSWQEQSIAEKMLFEASGTPYAGPERLERPKLAHSMGVEDPALEDA